MAQRRTPIVIETTAVAATSIATVATVMRRTEITAWITTIPMTTMSAETVGETRTETGPA
jgi:hypothetical protein